MIRKLTVMLLSGVICLIGITSALAITYNEAPMLRAKVAAGELPPVAERLPEEPSVLEPFEEIGQYGGRLVYVPPNRLRDVRNHGLFMRSPDGAKILPDIAKGYQYSQDYKTLTIYLRKGTRWSDGMLFTVDDILFWWEDIMLNEELSPAGPGTEWKPGGKVAEFEKVDDWTLSIHFAAPNPGLMAGKSHPYGMAQAHFFNPKHYLTKWHIDYNSEANELAKEEGYEYWWQALSYHQGKWETQKRIGLPTLSTWIVTEITPSYMVAERNPYFWQVDTAGNQLPYIDQLFVPNFEDPEVIVMKAIAGELDFVQGYELLPMDDYPLVKEGEKEGDYRVLLYRDFKSDGVISINPLTPDPVVRKILGDIRFRQALSLAIDREMINRVVFFGLSNPGQYAPLPSSSFYKEEWGTYYADYDVERANALLDEMGLGWDSEHVYRLKPGGGILELLLESGHGSKPEATMGEMLTAQWTKIGVKLVVRTEKATHDRITEDLTELFTTVPRSRGWVDVAIASSEPYFWGMGEGWDKWLSTDGKEGVEPPAEWKELKKWVDEVISLRPGTEEWISLKQKIWDFRVKQLWVIGIVGQAPIFHLVKNYVRNVAEEGLFGWSTAMDIAYSHNSGL
ncbi:hypothetical protein LCGC14_1085980 [marine sediment metagenome]|uniref:Solute-binding protein family 5 domain-containing protein n=1 Tax=marine sediment metagenome TaxID=412755 RepID=A0A0F9QJR8_9ZZZZ